MAKRKLRSQPRVPGQPKIYTGGGIPAALRLRVVADSREYGVSKSWVVATALAKHFGFDLLKYYEADKRTKK